MGMLLMLKEGKNEFRIDIDSKGSDEIDLVRSGLDDTMRSAYIAMSYRMHSINKIKDLRTSAMSIALKKIASSYVTLGL